MYLLAIEFPAKERVYRPTKVIVAEKVLNVAINTNKITQITISGHAIESCKSNFTRDDPRQ
jgi:hypothetical protein